MLNNLNNLLNVYRINLEKQNKSLINESKKEEKITKTEIKKAIKTYLKDNFNTVKTQGNNYFLSKTIIKNGNQKIIIMKKLTVNIDNDTVLLTLADQKGNTKEFEKEKVIFETEIDDVDLLQKIEDHISKIKI